MILTADPTAAKTHQMLMMIFSATANFCLTTKNTAKTLQTLCEKHIPVVTKYKWVCRTTRGPWGLYRSPVFVSKII